MLGFDIIKGEVRMRKIIDFLILIISLAGTAFGITSLLTVAGIYDIIPFYKTFDHILIGYVIVVASMAIGIMSFNLFAARRKRPAKTILSLGITTYSTILTIPLVLTFVFCLMAKCKVDLPAELTKFILPIYLDFMLIFKSDWSQYLVFAGGIVMGLIFIIVPIIMCRKTLKKKVVY